MSAQTKATGRLPATRARICWQALNRSPPDACCTHTCVVNQELLSLMRGKASKEDMRAVLAHAVELALDAYRRTAGEAAGAGATRFR